MTTTHLPSPAVMDTQDVQQVTARAHGGDVTALPALRSLLESRPEIWQQVGDLAR